MPEGLFEEQNICLINPPVKINDDLQDEEHTVTIGDLHGNTLKLWYVLQRHGIVSSTDENVAKNLCIYCQSGLKPLTKESKDPLKIQLVLFYQYLNQCHFNSKVILRIIGDELADRGRCDWLTLLLLKKLREQGVEVEILYSNHGEVFMTSYERAREIARTEGETALPFQSDPMGPGQADSMHGLGKLMALGLVTQSEVEDIYEQVYAPCIKLLSYSLSADGSSIKLFSHAPIPFEAIAVAAGKLNVKYEDQTAIALAQSIDRINKAFQQKLKQNEIHSLGTKGANKNQPELEDIFNYIAWNRNTLISRPASYHGYEIIYVHGHNLSRNNPENVINLDNMLGKSPDTDDPKHAISGDYEAYREKGRPQLTPKPEAVTFNPIKRNEIVNRPATSHLPHPTLINTKEIHDSQTIHDNTAFTIGDIEGDPFKLILTLISLGCIEGVSRQDCDKLGSLDPFIYHSTQNAATVREILSAENVKFNDKMSIRLMHHVLFRGLKRTDALMLWLIDLLDEKGIGIEIMASPFDYHFSDGLEKVIKHHNDANSSQLAKVPDSIKYIAEEFVDKTAGLAKIQKRYRRNYCTKLRLLSYTLDKHKSNIVIISNTCLAFDKIEALAKELKVPYQDKTAEQLATTIDAINDAYHTYLANYTVHEFFLQPSITAILLTQHLRAKRPASHNDYTISYLYAQPSWVEPASNAINIGGDYRKYVKVMKAPEEHQLAAKDRFAENTPEEPAIEIIATETGHEIGSMPVFEEPLKEIAPPSKKTTPATAEKSHTEQDVDIEPLSAMLQLQLWHAVKNTGLILLSLALGIGVGLCVGALAAIASPMAGIIAGLTTGIVTTTVIGGTALSFFNRTYSTEESPPILKPE